MGSQNKCDSHQECPYSHHADAGHPQSLERNMWIEGSPNSLLFSVYCAGCSLFILCIGLSHVYLMLLWLPWEDIHTWLTQERPFTLPVDLLTCCNISRKKAQLWSEISSAFFATAVVTPYMFPQPVKNIASAPHLRDLFHWRVCSSFTCPRAAAHIWGGRGLSELWHTSQGTSGAVDNMQWCWQEAGYGAFPKGLGKRRWLAALDAKLYHHVSNFTLQQMGGWKVPLFSQGRTSSNHFVLFQTCTAVVAMEQLLHWKFTGKSTWW